MKKYDFDSMGALWADRAREIVKNGIFVANSGGWDLWAYDGTVYSIPVKGSGGSALTFIQLYDTIITYLSNFFYLVLRMRAGVIRIPSIMRILLLKLFSLQTQTQDKQM